GVAQETPRSPEDVRLSRDRRSEDRARPSHPSRHDPPPARDRGPGRGHDLDAHRLARDQGADRGGVHELHDCEHGAHDGDRAGRSWHVRGFDGADAPPCGDRSSGRAVDDAPLPRSQLLAADAPRVVAGTPGGDTELVEPQVGGLTLAPDGGTLLLYSRRSWNPPRGLRPPPMSPEPSFAGVRAT